MIYRKEERAASSSPAQTAGKPDLQKLEIVPLADLFGAGRLMSQITLVPGAEVPVHTHHNEFEVYFVLTGEAEYYDNGETFPLRAGDVALCKEGGTHGVINKSEADFSMMAFVGYPASEK